MTVDTLQLSQEFVAGPARIRFDVLGTEPVDTALADKDFLDYRLADVRIETEPTLDAPDIVWERDAEKSIEYDGRWMTFRGDWASGPIQKVVVTMLALRLEEKGLHPFHASAVRYRDTTVLFLGGVIDEEGRVIDGSKHPFLKKRNVGTERADKAAPERGVEKFFGGMPTWEIYREKAPVDVVIVPAIDGNFDPSTVEMIPFERQFQSFHSLQNYFLLNELLAPGHPMPVVDTIERRAARAAFIDRFTQRPFHFVRAATPQVLLDEVERVL
jgi:hypothetical protein